MLIEPEDIGSFGICFGVLVCFAAEKIFAPKCLVVLPESDEEFCKSVDILVLF